MDQERTYKWIQDRLRDLHSGTLSELDRARLTELSKDDPFLQDALEGYQSSPGHDHISRLQTLSHRIQSKHISKRRKLFPSRSQWVIQAVAASLLLLLVTWSVIYYLEKENPAVFVASETNDATAADSVIDDASIKEDKDGDMAYEDQPPIELLPEEPGLRANAQSRYEAQAEAEAEDRIENNTVPTSANSQQGTVSIQSDVETGNQGSEIAYSVPAPASAEVKESGVDESIQETDQNVARLEDVSANANAMSTAMREQRVTGQIINSYGQPVTGAFIAIPNSNLVTTSDTYGQFELFIPGAKSPIEISSSGYHDTLMNVTKGQENVVVVLSPLYAHQGEIAYQKTELQKAKASTTFMNSALSFEEYVKTNATYPIQSQYSSNSHPVTIQFTVNSDGRPQKVTSVKSSVAKKFHTEAIRLVENGPLWTCDKFPCQKEYTIYFK